MSLLLPSRAQAPTATAPIPTPVPDEPARAGGPVAPLVSVLIPAYNAGAYLVPCLESLFAQSLDAERIEIVAVDDASTDGTAEVLDRYAARHPRMRVVHRAVNSGGASAPSNDALERARGTYVMFVGADDYLGREALERLVAMAEANDSDVVLGKLVGHGRSVPGIFKRNVASTDVFSSDVYSSLRVTSLFRRDMVEREALRFPTEFHYGEDSFFAAGAYLAARRISVLSDYDCYHAVRRDDGGNITTRLRRPFPMVAAILAYSAERVPPGERRDQLHARHFRVEFWNATASRRAHWLAGGAATDPVARQAREVVAKWYTAGIGRRLSRAKRVYVELIARGQFVKAAEQAEFIASGAKAPQVIEEGRVFEAQPHFRDPEAALADDFFDATDDVKLTFTLRRMEWREGVCTFAGTARASGVDPDPMRAALVLRHRGTGEEFLLDCRTPAVPPGTGPRRAGDGDRQVTAEVDFTRVVDGGPLPSGVWDVFLRLGAPGLELTTRVGRRRGGAVDTMARRPVALGVEHVEGRAREVTAVPYFTDPHENVSVDVFRRLPAD
ncbi:glycosyltransferase [Streptomyces sp. NPDC001941]|uniref:glycosyltransferase family 2 protein n=1 Tax=Streptomyces sp. NPDC001941 TaxID=3154659 RepID=UPI0033196101